MKNRCEKTMNGLPFIDLFAGCGGLSFGMELAGFTSVFATGILDAKGITAICTCYSFSCEV